MPPKKKAEKSEEQNYYSDISEVESLLSDDESLSVDEGILGSNFNLSTRHKG